MATYDPPRSSGVYEDHYGRQYAEPPPIQPLPSGRPYSSQRAALAAPESRPAGRRLTTIFVVFVVAVVAAAVASTFLTGRDPAKAAFAYPSASTSGSPAALPAPANPSDLTFSAAGDVMLGAAPPANGRGIFDAVRGDLAADLAMANLEQALTDDTSVSRCMAQNAGKNCVAYRSPTSAVDHLRGAGFNLVTLANDHAYDFGSPGYRETQETLDRAGIRHTGAPQQVTVVERKGVKVAVVGFASYYWTNLCNELEEAAKLVRDAAGQADLVLVQVHMGAEGADRTRTRNQVERHLGQYRCNPVAFAHTVVDAGADLVIGHGPQVMRAMEFYKGRLIAYSLGTFVGYKQTIAGPLGVGGILKVTLRPDGAYVRGSLMPTVVVAPGVPHADPKRQSVTLVGGLSKTDFPSTGARFAADGTITPP